MSLYLIRFTMVFLRPAVLSCFMSVIFFTAISATLNEGDIRLSGSADKWQGRVEIFHNKTWGTICDDYWDINYAKVVCRQLGFEDALEVYASADFGKGTGPIHLDRLRCTGTESRLIDCDTRGWNHGYCDHSEDVGVACLHPSDIPPGGCTFDVDWCGYTNANDDDFDWLRQSKRTPSYNTGPAHDHTTGNGSYIYIETSSPRVQGEMARVVSPPFTGAKCIQFYYIMKGRTVNELNVYIDNGLARKIAWQSKGENRTWNKGLFPVTQSGSVKIILEGLVGVNYQGDIAIDDVTPLKTSCAITPKDAKPEPIDLSNITSTVRLVNGNVSSAGRIEVLHNGRWGTICGVHFHLPAARVVCKQLGYLDVEILVPCCLFGAGKGTVWLDNLHCEGREPAITMCPHKGWGMTTCPHTRDVGVICKTKNTLKDIRLAGSLNEYEGRVEVKIGGIWGTIMDYGWDIFDSTVFCRQLGFGGATSAYSQAHYGQGQGPIWFSTVLCQGNETELWQCNKTQRQIQWRPHLWHWNLHKNDASAECYDIRLTGGKTSMEGRLEMRYMGAWGTVCNQGWSMNAAKVACRNLGFSKVIATKVDYKIKVTGRVDPIVSRFNCNGDEPVLGLCGYFALISVKHGCTHDTDVTIVCGHIATTTSTPVATTTSTPVATTTGTPVATTTGTPVVKTTGTPVARTTGTPVATTTGTPVSKPTGTPGHKDCSNCPGTCYRTIKHSGFCICSTSGGDVADSKCDATEGIEVSDVAFAKLTLDKWNSDDFKTNLIKELNSYCSTDKTCKKIVNGSKFEIQDIIVLDNWPTTFNGKLNLKFIVLVPIQNSRNVLPRDVITTMSQKQKNKLAGYEVVVTRKPVMPPAAQTSKKNSKTIDIVVPIVVILAIVGVAVVAYVIYKKRSALRSASNLMSQRYTHLSSSDDDDDPLLSMEDDHDHGPTTVTA